MPTCITNTFFSGYGTVLFAEVDADTGVLQEDYFSLGDTPSFSITSEEERLEIRESCSGNNTIAADVSQSTDIGISVDARNFDPDILARFWRGSASTTSGTSVSDEAITFVAVNGVQKLANENITSGTLTVTADSGGSPNLTEGTDYSVDYGSGMITLLSTANLGGSPQFTVYVNYDFGNYTDTEALTVSEKTYSVIMQGQNKVNAKAVTVKINKVRLQLPSSMDLYTDEEFSLEMTGRLLQDSTVSSGSEYFTVTQNA